MCIYTLEAQPWRCSWPGDPCPVPTELRTASTWHCKSILSLLLLAGLRLGALISGGLVSHCCTPAVSQCCSLSVCFSAAFALLITSFPAQGFGLPPFKLTSSFKMSAVCRNAPKDKPCSPMEDHRVAFSKAEMWHRQNHPEWPNSVVLQCIISGYQQLVAGTCGFDPLYLEALQS